MAPKEVVSPKSPQYPGVILSYLDFQVRWEIIGNPEPLGELQEYATKTKESRRMLQGTFLSPKTVIKSISNKFLLTFSYYESFCPCYTCDYKF